MAAKKRFTTEQIVAKLREAEKLQAQGLTIPQLCKRLGISDQTFYRWRLKYGALKEGRGAAAEGVGAGERSPEADRGRAGVGHQHAQGSATGKLVSPSLRRAAVGYLMKRHRVSERRACKVVAQHRSTNRYAPAPGDFEDQLVAAMHKLAEAHPRYGYRRVHALLVRDGWSVNVKRVERLWRREDLRVRPRRKDRGQRADRDR